MKQKQTYSIEFLPEEQELLNSIELDVSSLEHKDWQRNGDSVIKLFKLLKGRKAIPEHRLKYFLDADYNVGGHGKSRMQGFEKNGGISGDDILRNGHFLTHFRYFLYGPDLSADIITKFQQAVNECGMITSGDIEPLSKLARQLARDEGAGKDDCEEFFKLALEVGIHPLDATTIRKSVQQIKR